MTEDNIKFIFTKNEMHGVVIVIVIIIVRPIGYRQRIRGELLYLVNLQLVQGRILSTVELMQ